ncbi:RNA polymerase subunit sigma [Phocaeicola coprophilus]|uniref:RNA polymerase subunit sigma n=1 Tax=Phocaeicola coprophilus TaxID=387090 RepID=UPI0026DB41AA|nr:RNA polymerase subunit sigma [Phocaeicola coprophilus]
MAKKKNQTRVETRKDEIRVTTRDLKQMLNKYLVHNLFRKWTEDFMDQDTGEVVSIERNELILEAGTYLGKEECSTINFYIQEGSITEVEVSNQKRMAFENDRDALVPYIAQVMLDKKKKFLLKAQNIDQAREIVKDYTELNFKGPYRITLLKEFDYFTILVDKLSVTPIDEIGKLAIEFSDLYSEEQIKALMGEGEEDIPEPKFYNIEARIILTGPKEEDKEEINQTFVVETYNAERAMLIINKYLNDKQDELEKAAKEKGREFDRKIIHASIEQSSIIPVNSYIPEEFSIAYAEK